MQSFYRVTVAFALVNMRSKTNELWSVETAFTGFDSWLIVRTLYSYSQGIMICFQHVVTRGQTIEDTLYNIIYILFTFYLTDVQTTSATHLLQKIPISQAKHNTNISSTISTTIQQKTHCQKSRITKHRKNHQTTC